MAPAAWCTCERACFSAVVSSAIGAERREIGQSARERLVDLALHPGQRSEVEFRNGLGDHGLKLLGQ